MSNLDAMLKYALILTTIIVAVSVVYQMRTGKSPWDLLDSGGAAAEEEKLATPKVDSRAAAAAMHNAEKGVDEPPMRVTRIDEDAANTLTLGLEGEEESKYSDDDRVSLDCDIAESDVTDEGEPEPEDGESLNEFESCSAGGDSDEYEIGSFCSDDEDEDEDEGDEEDEGDDGDEGDSTNMTDLMAMLFEKIAEPLLEDLDFDTSGLQETFLNMIDEQIESATAALGDDDELTVGMLESIIAATASALEKRLESYAGDRRAAMAAVREAVSVLVEGDHEPLAKMEAIRLAVREAFALTDDWVFSPMPDDSIKLIADDVTRRMAFSLKPTKSSVTGADGKKQDVFVL